MVSPVWAAEMAAVSEGCCPRHGGHLAADGWCRRCAAWWRIDRSRNAVIMEFPDAGVVSRPA